MRQALQMAASKRASAPELEAVYHSPHDDGARLAYAKWARNRGIPHGEFVALQLVATRRRLTAREAAREAALLKAHERTWLGALAPVVTSARFRRGFPIEVSIWAGRDSDLWAVNGVPEWSTIEAIEFEHIIGQACRRTAGSQVGIGHPVFRALRSVSGLHGSAVQEVCGVHGHLEKLAWFVCPDATPSMRPAPPPGLVAEAIATLPALRHLRIGNDSITTTDEVDEEVAAAALDGTQPLDRVSLLSNHRVAWWLERLMHLPKSVLELRSDGCGVFRHDGMTLSVGVGLGRVSARANVVFTSAPKQHELTALVIPLPFLAKGGLDEVQVTIADAAQHEWVIRRVLAGARLPKLKVTIIDPKATNEP